MNIVRALTDARIDRCDGEILMGFAMKKDRSWVIAHGDVALTPEEQQKWNACRQRRGKHEPIAYITGEKEFFGRSFSVDPSVLIPRPSTEGLVEMVVEILCTHTLTMTRRLDTAIVGIADVWGPLSDVRTIVDVGTGSGCIAVTLACELPEFHIIATDTSAAALDIARMNAGRHGVADRIRFLHGNLLEPLCHPNPACSSSLSLGVEDRQGNSRGAATPPFLLISNPPYIPEAEHLHTEVAAYEPLTALYAGPDGLAVLAPLLAAARAHPSCRGFVMECREGQDLHFHNPHPHPNPNPLPSNGEGVLYH